MGPPPQGKTTGLQATLGLAEPADPGVGIGTPALTIHHHATVRTDMGRTYERADMEDTQRITAELAEHASRVCQMAGEIISSIDRLQPDFEALTSKRMDEAIDALEEAIRQYKKLWFARD
jgi:hypothetical protein